MQQYLHIDGFAFPSFVREMDNPLNIEAGMVIEEQHRRLVEWLQTFHLGPNLLQQALDAALPELWLFQRRPVTFSFQNGNAGFEINNRHITVSHPRIVIPARPPSHCPCPSPCPWHPRLCWLQYGHIIRKELTFTTSQAISQIFPKGDLEDERCILSDAMEAWYQLPHVPLEFDVTLIYYANTRQMNIEGDNLIISFPAC